MKIKTLIACFILACATTSCIQDEALNSEAAIDACVGNDIQQAAIDSENFTIQLYVSKAADLTKVNINFQLPVGARIAPASPQTGDNVSSSVYNFKDENPRIFKVTSENTKFVATYTITLWQTEMPDFYHFETLSSDNPFHIFYEQDNTAGSDGGYVIRRLEWASGNPGFQLTAMAKNPTEYPTVQVAGGPDGSKCLKLETKSTGSFGEMVKMPIAAGNLFIGSFDKANALSDAMKATHFGFPFFYYPQTIRGFYKYKAGDKFTSNGAVVEGRQDHCDIYGVLYETDENVDFLDGSTSLTSPNIISLARKAEGTYWPETDSWLPFELDFVPKPGKSIDQEKLQKGIYKLAIVFSSSVDGAKFDGAVGSTLYIDEVKLISTDQQ